MLQRTDFSANNREVRLLGIDELCAYLSLGKSKAVEVAKEIDCGIKIGKRCLYDRKKIDAWIDSQVDQEIM